MTNFNEPPKPKYPPLPPHGYLSQWDDRIIRLQRQVSLLRAALHDIAHPPAHVDELAFIKRRAEAALEIFKETEPEGGNDAV